MRRADLSAAEFKSLLPSVKLVLSAGPYAHTRLALPVLDELLHAPACLINSDRQFLARCAVHGQHSNWKAWYAEDPPIASRVIASLLLASEPKIVKSGVETLSTFWICGQAILEPADVARLLGYPDKEIRLSLLKLPTRFGQYRPGLKPQF